ncbi:MAG: type II secretion system F family protein [Chloroflexi bacterium]|nr:type II secretion system F family protein [Chloroflexota bacterium]
MPVSLIVFLLLAGAALAVRHWAAERTRNRALANLDTVLAPESDPPQDAAEKVFPSRYRWLAWAAGAATATALAALTPLALPFALSAGFLTGVLISIAEQSWADRQMAGIETQLADAIDLTVGSLRAGTALLAALENALAASDEPLKSQLGEVIGRIRLGETPAEALMELPERVPLETFRFFALSLAVHWETGGSMAGTLASIGRTVRDRIELSRRVRAQSVEVHTSVVGVFLITYVLALIMWRSNPETVTGFLRSEIGATIAAAAILLQGVGVLWISNMGRVES